MIDPTFDIRLAERIRRYSASVVVPFDPVAIATTALRRGPRRAPWSILRLPWLGRRSRLAWVALLIIVGLIVAGVAGGFVGNRVERAHTPPSQPLVPSSQTTPSVRSIASPALSAQPSILRNGLIAYVHEGTIEIVATDGTAPRTLVADPQIEFAGPVSWSKDGSQIVAVTKDQRIYVANSDGRSLRRVGSGYDPVWLSDGDLLFRADRAIWRSAPTGGPPKRVATVDADFVALVASADGSKVAFLAGGSPELKGLHDRIKIVDLRPPSSQFTLTAAALGLRAIYRLAFSPDGTRLAVNGTACPTSGIVSPPQECPMIVIAALDGSIERSIGNATTFALLPAWSFDGSRLAYVQNVVDGSGALVSSTIVVTSAGGQQVASIRVPDFLPMLLKWSPDGTALLQVNADDSGATQRAVVSNLSGETILDLPTSADVPDWQPLPNGAPDRPSGSSSTP